MQTLEPAIRTLRLLQVIAEGHGLVQAAEKIGMSQSAASHAIAALTTVAARGSLGKGDGIWLLAATAATIALLAPRGGMRRWGGAVLVISWIAFAAVQ